MVLTGDSNSTAWNYSWQTDDVDQLDELLSPASGGTIAILSAMFFAIGSLGVFGNVLVIFAIVLDTKMRSSVTNILIVNLAVSDLVIMVSCVPDIVQFMGNKGWVLGLVACKVLRFIEVSALYSSVLTLVTLCVERYVAITHPIYAHIVCQRTRIIATVAIFWPISMAVASPNLMWHDIVDITPNFKPCIMRYPSYNYQLVLKFGECFAFYVVPLIIQAVMYIRIGKQLFRNDRTLDPSVIGRSKFKGTIETRKGVVKMLIAGVTVYFICFSPHQILLFYNTFSGSPFQETWSFLIFVNVMAYLSSAVNPLLYSIFSNKFRRRFRSMVQCGVPPWDADSERDRQKTKAVRSSGSEFSSSPLGTKVRSSGRKRISSEETEV